LIVEQLSKDELVYTANNGELIINTLCLNKELIITKALETFHQ